MRSRTWLRSLLGVAALALAAVPIASTAYAISTTYEAVLQTFPNVHGSGTAKLTLIDTDTLTIEIHAIDLVANQTHPIHIHGQPEGRNSTVPTLACCDLDHDSFIEVLEGALAYGPIIQNISDPPGDPVNGFPKAQSNGHLDFLHTYNLNDPQTFAGVAPPLGFANPTKSLLFPLENRHIVIHGDNVPEGAGAGTPGEVDGTPGYKMVLPVANGELFVTSGSPGVGAVPEPASVLLFGTGLMGLGWFARRRRHGAQGLQQG